MADTTFIWQQKGKPWQGVAIYHVTASAVGRHPVKAAFGELQWTMRANQVETANVVWSSLGRSIWNCIQEIPVRYPEIRICAARIMPDHLHMILHVTQRMDTSFNKVLRGWVCGCRKAAKECGLQEDVFSEKPFIRVMTYKGQLQTMVKYVLLNPYRMAVRQMFPQHFAILRGIAIAGQQYAAVGNLHLLYEPELMAVHVHKEWVWNAQRGDNQRLRDYKNGCILRARQGTVLVSPFISPDEAAVRDVALREGLPMIYILDNGMPDSAKYKPPGNLIEAIANAEVERGSQCGQSNGDNIGSYPVLPTNNTRIAANCCDITTSEQQGAQQRSDKATSNVSVTNSAVMSINLSIYFRIRKFSQILHAFCIYVQ